MNALNNSLGALAAFRTLATAAAVLWWIAAGALTGAAPAQAPRDTVTVRTGTGSIRGLVLDVDTGRPLRRVQISLESDPPEPFVLTDEQGRFAFNNLAPGRYALVASKVGYATLAFGQRRPGEPGKQIELANGQTFGTADFQLPRAGVIVARVTDDLGEPIVDVSVSVQQQRFVDGERQFVAVSTKQTDVLGERRFSGLVPGTYYVSAGASGSDVLPADNRRVYVTTYHPGTALPHEAQPVTLNVGDEVRASFSLVRARPAQVTGTVKMSDGSPFAGQSLALTLPGSTLAVAGASRTIRTRPDGSFLFANVLPGDYFFNAFPIPAATGRLEYAALTVSVAGDLTLSIDTSPGGTARGRLVFDTGVPAGVRASGLQVGAVPMTQRPGSAGRVTTNDDWSFEISGLTGPTIFRLAQPTNPRGAPTPVLGWYLKAVTLDGRDVTDTPLDFAGDRRVQDLQVIVTQKRTTVTGVAVDAQGASVADYVAVVFPQDRAQRTARSRFIAAGRPDQRGNFSIAGLPPGRYVASAIDYLPTGEEHDQDLLDRLEARGTPLVLNEGESAVLKLIVSQY